MLQLRPGCENCKKALPPESTEAMICSYECTFCRDCVTSVLYNVCPNCGGGFEKRPVRPKKELEKNPASTKVVYKSIDMLVYKKLQDTNRNIAPEKR